MDYQIVHAIEGRIRIRIPLLAEETNYNSKLQSLVESLNFVTDVRINPQAESIVVTYKYKKISCPAMSAQLEQAIQQVAPPVESPSAPSKAPSTATANGKSSQPHTHEVEQTVYTGEAINVDEDPWGDKTTTQQIS
ncbi:heavy metal translocating P-type ATPase [Calothrix sp. NIES-4071]|nr:heavy metal translocating P-type ATPase [Calothrix sp. NIES-4071]BAZ57853.1 heavy metal translocating P-type ATPase [Calothrix sp. NIES-4105]